MKKGLNSIKKCVLCLHQIGFGGRSIERLTNTDRSLIGRWIRKSGLPMPFKSSKPFKIKQSTALSVADKLLLAGLVTETYQVKLRQDYWRCHPTISTELWKKRYVQDPAFRIKEVHRLRAGKFIKRTIAGAKGNRVCSTRVLLGCTRLQLMEHIQDMFRDGMNWNNHGTIWHVDHIRPIASFNMLNESDQRACFHYTNLQPLLKAENQLKSDRWSPRAAAASPDCQKLP